MDTDFSWMSFIIFWVAVLAAYLVARRLVKPVDPKDTYANTGYDRTRDL